MRFVDNILCKYDLEKVKEQLHFWSEFGDDVVEPEDAQRDLDNVYALTLDSDEAVEFLVKYATSSDFIKQLNGTLPKVGHKYEWVEDRWIDATEVISWLKVYGDVQ